MTVFGTDMHVATFIFVVCEGLFSVSQLIFYLQNPADKNRKYYLVLLGLLIIYNITGGLFPDPDLPLSSNIQINLAYGSGFAMDAHFPYYFYRVFGLNDLRWNARIGVWIFLIAPFILFFCVGLPLLGDLPTIVWYGLAIPLLYAIYLIVIIFLSIRNKFKGYQNSLESILTYSAAVPWVLLPVFSYMDSSQFVEVVCTNAGFIIITFLFIRNMIYENRRVFEKLNDLDQKRPVDPSAFFGQRCFELGLTKRECEVAEQAKSKTMQQIRNILQLNPQGRERYMFLYRYRFFIEKNIRQLGLALELGRLKNDLNLVKGLGMVWRSFVLVGFDPFEWVKGLNFFLDRQFGFEGSEEVVNDRIAMKNLSRSITQLRSKYFLIN